MKLIGRGPSGGTAEKDHSIVRPISAVNFLLAERKNNIDNMKMIIEEMEKIEFLEMLSFLFFGLSGFEIGCEVSLESDGQSIQLL